MNAGDVFRLVNVADKHAKVIISDPVNYPQQVVFVGMTSWDRREDQSCILEKGDHSTVVNRTCMTYSRANAKASNAELDALANMKRIEVFERVSGDLLSRIRVGALRSLRTPGNIKAILSDQRVMELPQG